METEPHDGIPFVGIGASAGGLAALTRLLGAVPADIGMAFMVVVHLNPSLPTAMVGLLEAATSLRVEFASHGTRPEPGVVYVAPPGQQLKMAGHSMQLGEGGVLRPIDAFLESLAASAGQRVIGILLSGAGSDGMLGLTAIREASGITMVQDGSATFSGMARAAIRAGVVDRVLSPEGIADALIELRRTPYVCGELRLDASAEAEIEGALGPLLLLLLSRCGLDFRGYKPPTLRRRVLRRAVLRSASTLEDYLQILRVDPSEVEALCADLLIKVTEFFRDPEVFAALSAQVLPKLYAQRNAEGPLRIWVVGCSTGEEAYSIAMTVLEHEGATDETVAVQIFATDVSTESLSFARAGRYPLARCAGVSQARRERFFIEVGDDLQVRQHVREMCVFARHDITTDPPFSRMDLVSCRNVLIYFGRELQERVAPTLRYALQPWGGLLLGRAESVGTSGELFEADQLAIGYHPCRKGSIARLPKLRVHGSTAASLSVAAPPRTDDLEMQAARLLVREYSPPGVIVDEQLRAVSFIGDTSRFLINGPGVATLQISKMVHPRLRLSLSEALALARERPEPVRQNPTRLRDARGSAWVSVLAMALDHGSTRGYLVVFEDQSDHHAKSAGVRTLARDWGRSMVRRLRRAERREPDAADRRQAESNQSHLDKLVQQYEGNVEELQTTTEELRSSNEELQCTNEELQTAREEVLATNEELTTVNEELESRNQTLARSHDDLTNVLSSAALAILVLGKDRRLRWFSPGAEMLFNLRDGDIGRALDQLGSGLELPPPEELVDFDALALEPKNLVTRDATGRWYSVGIRRYRRSDGTTDGAVIAIVDVDDLKRAEAELLRQRSIAQWIVDAVRQPLFTVNQSLCVASANPAFCAMLATTHDTVQGKPVEELELGLESPQTRAWLQGVLDGTGTVDELEVVQAGSPSRHLRLCAHHIDPNASESLALVVVDDVTSRRLHEQGEAEMIGRVLAAQADEREAVARELHDETGQALSALIVGLRGASEHIEQPDVRGLVDQLRERARELLDGVGRLARGLHPPSLDALGLEGALRGLVEGFSFTHAIEVDLQFLGDRDLSTVPSATQLVLYRAAQEALTNIARHAAASHVVVHLTGGPHEVSLHVADDGHGFVPTPAPARAGIGLALMRRRLSLVQGRLSLQAAPAEGTTLDIIVPISEQADA